MITYSNSAKTVLKNRISLQENIELVEILIKKLGSKYYFDPRVYSINIGYITKLRQYIPFLCRVDFVINVEKHLIRLNYYEYRISLEKAQDLAEELLTIFPDKEIQINNW